MKTTFNPIWVGFNIHELRDTVVKAWGQNYFDGSKAPTWSFDKIGRVYVSGTGYTVPARRMRRADPEAPVGQQSTNLEEEPAGIPVERFYASRPPDQSTMSREALVELLNPTFFRRGMDLPASAAEITAWETVKRHVRFAGLYPKDFSVALLRDEQAQSLTEYPEFDMLGSNLPYRKWLLSRKRTRNLSDLAFSWKREILASLRIVPDSDLFSVVEEIHTGDDLVAEDEAALPPPLFRYSRGRVTLLRSGNPPNPNSNLNIPNRSDLEWISDRSHKRPRGAGDQIEDVFS